MKVNGEIAINSLKAGYRKKRVLGDLNVADIPSGKITVLTGPNAAGKSTLLRVLAGLHPAEGKISYKGEDLLNISQRKRAEFVSFMPQAAPSDVRLTVIESLITALKAGKGPGENKNMITVLEHSEKVLERIGIKELAMEYIDRLSGGQRQMVSLAQTMVRDPEILLLDEPTSALDLRYQMKVLKLIREYADEGKTVIMVLHDLNQVLRWADNVLVLHNGNIISEGAPLQALSAEIVGEIYNVKVHIEKNHKGLPYMVMEDEL